MLSHAAVAVLPSYIIVSKNLNTLKSPYANSIILHDAVEMHLFPVKYFSIIIALKINLMTFSLDSIF